MYLMNAWYAAGWSNEITSKPLARTILDEPIVMYRGANNRVAALEDRRCHRGMPLSQGEVFDNNIRCEYHGMLFDGGGRCVDIPGQTKIPSQAKVRSFSIEERNDLIWIWMGDPEADLDKIVSYPWHNTWPYRAKSEILKCNYLLASDNLLDQTHAAYVHKSTLSSNPYAYATAKMETTPTPDGVKFIRWLLNCVPPNLYAGAVPFKGLVDRWGEFVRGPVLHSPVHRRIGCRHGRLRQGFRDGGFGLRMFYGITPETEDTTWFFWSTAKWPPAKRPGGNQQLFRSIEEAFKEDDHVLEAQHQTLRRLGDRRLINIASDVARVHARNALERKIAAERGISTDQVVTTV